MAENERVFEWDVFVSHASEDKEKFVRPLADLLSRLGVKAWYDETELKPGDSLSRSLDKGLSLSRHGIVVLSKAFFTKVWTEHELRGLIAREIGSDAVILPVWYGVTRDEVLAYSPPLADKVAVVAAEKSAAEVAVEILRTARPDLHESLIRRLEYLRLIHAAPVELMPLSEIKPGPRRREALPAPLLTRIDLIHTIFSDVTPLSFERIREGYLRDLVPEDELRIWERMAVAYMKYVANHEPDLEERSEAFSTLLAISMNVLQEASTRQEQELLDLYRSAGTGRTV